MQTVTTIAELSRALNAERQAGHSIGFVPTMGALHAGHRSLMALAAAHTDVLVASVFVNPLQFGPTEDLDRYPRPFEADQQAAAAERVNYLFHPSVEEMYPEGAISTRIDVGPLGQPWEGSRRPGHFAGMATVVAKLFNIVGPCTAFFGEKDWQQLCIIRHMVRDLSIPVEVASGPTLRERDGLALSSRNVYLTEEDRFVAARLSSALSRTVEAFLDGETNAGLIRAAGLELLRGEQRLQLDYFAIVDDQLQEVPTVTPTSRVLVAGTVGTTHLIDNAGFTDDERQRLQPAEE